MKVPLPPTVQPTNDVLTLIASIDEFKGERRALGNLGPETLRTLRRIATIESAGSSTRIEGARLSDSEVEQLVGRLAMESFQSCDEQEVAGYAYVIERNKEAYYLALRRTQTSFEKSADWEPWLLFFLRSLKSQTGRLRERLEKAPSPHAESNLPGDLSLMAGRLLRLLEERKALSVGEAAEALAVNRSTLKGKFAELTEKGFAELHGKGRGAHYRRING